MFLSSYQNTSESLGEGGVQMGTSEFYAGGYPAMDQNPIQGGSRNTPSYSILQKPGYTLA